MKASEIAVGHLVKNNEIDKFGIVCTDFNYEKTVFFPHTMFTRLAKDCVDDYEDCGRFNLEFQEKVISTTTLNVTASVEK
jgi:hypothetical protein